MNHFFENREVSSDEDFYKLLGCDERSSVSSIASRKHFLRGLVFLYFQGGADFHRIQAAGEEMPPRQGIFRGG